MKFSGLLAGHTLHCRKTNGGIKKQLRVFSLNESIVSCDMVRSQGVGRSSSAQDMLFEGHKFELGTAGGGIIRIIIRWWWW
jgi:hypothetical protein